MKIEELINENRRRISLLRKDIKSFIRYNYLDMSQETKDYLDPYFSMEERNNESKFFILNKEGTKKINIEAANVYDLGNFFQKKGDFKEIISNLEKLETREIEISLYLNSLAI